MLTFRARARKVSFFKAHFIIKTYTAFVAVYEVEGINSQKSNELPLLIRELQ